MKALLLLAILILSLIPSAMGEGVWPMFKGDLRHTGLSNFTGSEHNTLKWRFQTGDRVVTSPAIADDGTVYFGSYDRNLYALYPNGTEKWRFKAAHLIDSSPAIGSNGTVYFGSWDGNLYAISADGKGLWKVSTNTKINASPTIKDDIIYFGTDGGYMYALRPNGSSIWSFQAKNRIVSAPAIDKDTLYFTSFDGTLYALYLNGTLKWKFETGYLIFSSPAIGDDGTIYFGSYNNSTYAINPDGTEKWRFNASGIIQSSPSIGKDGTIYFGSFDTYLYALYPNGTEKWRFKTGDLVVTSPAIDKDGNIYFGSVDKYLYALYPNGTEKWRFKTNARIFSSPAIASDGTVYVGSVDGSLYAIGTPLISPDWKYPLKGSVGETVGFSNLLLHVTDVKNSTIELIMKNIGNSAKIIDLKSFKLIDKDGIEHRAIVEREEFRLDSNDILRFSLSFNTFADTLVYDDERGIRLSIDLSRVKEPRDEEPKGLFIAGNNINRRLVGESLELTILDERFEQDPSRYIATISLKNIGREKVKYDDLFIYIKDEEGRVYMPEGDFSGTLDVGKSVKGTLVFNLDRVLDKVIFVYDDSNSYLKIPEFPYAIIALIISLLSSIAIRIKVMGR